LTQKTTAKMTIFVRVVDLWIAILNEADLLNEI
jgi:hypothetical protein